jgi:two-component system LytT family response regulator
MKCYIVDDLRASIRTIKQLIERTDGLVLVGSAINAETALKELLLGSIVADITFMDIDMPGMSGIELAALLKEKTNIIFTTAHRHYGPEAFELNAIDYLVKPVSYERFLKAIDHATSILAVNNRSEETPAMPFVFVPGDGRKNFIKLDHQDVIYIKAESNYVQIVLKNGIKLSYMSMEQVLQTFPKNYFVRVHKSFIINLAEVHEIEATVLTMNNKHSVPIGRNYKDVLIKAISGSSSGKL